MAFERLRRAVKRAAVAAWAPLAALVAQTTNTTTSSPSQAFDYSALTNILTYVIPLLVLMAIIRMLFRSFSEFS